MHLLPRTPLALLILLTACGNSPFPEGGGGDGGAPRRDGGSSRDGGNAMDGGRARDGGNAMDGGADVDGGADIDGGSDRYHPDGWSASSVHGQALKRQEQNCRTCHGADLTGGDVGVSCDSCHNQGWRTNCTFCHGGTDGQTGAPPRGLFDATGRFPAHTKHVTQNIHAAFDCTQCHVKPTDVLSPNHVFDSTPAQAETVFNAGLSAQGSWNGTQCSNVYCHGNGRTNGTVQKTATNLTCSSCHADQTNAIGWFGMSGQHARHLGEGLGCHDCHANTVGTDHRTISNPALHVNGQKDVAFTAGGFTYTGGRCTGNCHGEGHGGQRW